jgi:hypothetical protein
MERVIRHLKDDIYQLVEVRSEPHYENIIKQGSLSEIEAYLALEERGLL